jgi:hypothetical protein
LAKGLGENNQPQLWEFLAADAAPTVAVDVVWYEVVL